MTLIISDDGSIVTNSVTIEDVPAIQITGNSVQFTNATGGILRAAAFGSPAIVISGIGSHTINQAGALIETANNFQTAVQGSSGADRFDNYGIIRGTIRLGDGADVYNEYFSSASIPTPNVSLGSGSDTYNLQLDGGPVIWGSVSGGSGEDYLNIQGAISIVRGFSEFEHLTVGPDVDNLQGFYGLLSLTLTPGGFNNFTSSLNPTVDVALNRNGFSIGPGASFRNITGGDDRETLTFNTSFIGVSTLTGAVNMGGGDDSVQLSLFDSTAVNPDIAGTVDGGSGNDYISITSRSTNAVDLLDFLNFETLGVGTQALPGTATARVINANGFLDIITADDVSIGLSNSPDAQLWGAFRGTTTLESTTTIGFVRYEYAPTNLADIENADAQYNMILINNGAILAAVELFTGDDIYDGSQGSTGGTIFGYAGNDTLTGGAGAERIEGGFGSDILTGNGGADRLFGNAGDDLFNADALDIEIDGGAGVDRLVFAGSGALAASISSIEAIELSAGANLALSATQVASGLALNTAVTGNGTLSVNMDATGALFTKFFAIASTVSITINGSTGVDIIKLGDALNTVNGGDGTDQIKGGNLVDTINGGDRVDKINGEGGADILTGGAGNDVFKYGAAADSGIGIGADRITDYQVGLDRLNFARIDTNASLAGDQSFSFIGVGSFTGTGTAQIRYGNSGGNLLVLADINGDGVADMEVILQGLAGQTLTMADFVL